MPEEEEEKENYSYEDFSNLNFFSFSNVIFNKIWSFSFSFQSLVNHASYNIIRQRIGIAKVAF